jgi:hydroxymethylglutaryl-CoA lyase
MSALPEHVDIREVALRDGLQIEDPIPLSDKVKMLEAIVATGVKEVEATAFVSPTKVPALADAAELAAELANYRDAAGVEFSALVASPNGAKRAIAAGCTPSNTWCRRPTGTATPTSAGPPPRPRR